AHISGTAAGKAHVCPIRGDSTFEEAAQVDKCVSQYDARSVLLVTSDYHTRRALATFKRILPRYQWSVAASEDSAEFGKNWWEHREWAKQTVTEWSKFIWWEAVDQWRAARAAGGSRPMMASAVMDFPEPDSPTRARTSPGAIENERLLTAATGAAGFGAGWAC